MLLRDIILFLNTVVNTATELEDRLEIRADMIYSGNSQCKSNTCHHRVA